MRKKLTVVLLNSLITLSSTATAEDSATILPPTVVTATRTEMLPERVGRSLEVQTVRELEERGVVGLPDAIKDLSGVRSFSLGGPGAPGTAPIEIRGFRTGGTRLLLSGMALNDPSSVSGTYEQFFGFMDITGTARVEVLKGGAGVLYGSDAQGGVVNLILQQPADGASGQFRFEGGSFDTFTESAQAGVKGEVGSVIGAISRTDSDGLGARGDYENTTMLLNGVVEVVPGRFTVEPLFRAVIAENALQTSPTADDSGRIIPNQATERNSLEASAYFIGAVLRAAPSRLIDSTLRVYMNDTERDFFFDFSGFESKSTFQGQTVTTDLENIVEHHSGEFLFGAVFEHQEVDNQSEDFRDKAEREKLGAYAFNRSAFFRDALELAGGARVTHLSDIDEVIPTLEFSANYQLVPENTILRGSIAQGFRAPTLFESKGRIVDFNNGSIIQVGNSSLQEEDSLSWDAGLRKYVFGERMQLDAAFFQIDSDETILFDFVNSTHRNGGGGKSQGIETSVSFFPCEQHSVLFAYTHLSKADGLDGRRRQRTPRNWFSLTTNSSFAALHVSATLRFRESQELEFFDVPFRVKEEQVAVLDLYSSYQLSKSVEVFLKAQNVFDVNYTEAGYQMPGAALLSGVKVGLGT